MSKQEATFGDRFVAGVRPPRPEDLSHSYWFPFRKRRMLVEVQGPFVRTLCGPARPPFDLSLERLHYFGAFDGVSCYAVWLDDDCQAPPAMDFLPLPALFEALPRELYSLCDRASQIVEWDRTHRYCSRCGAKTRRKTSERAKLCPRCELASFPALNPAVIVLVERGDQILLARSPHFPAGMFSVLAGFVEPGETLEEAVKREVLEEVGIRIKNLNYFASQSWPFPHSLMIAFTAQYAGGELAADQLEIEKAGWYRYDQLPQIPGPISIARQLIDWFLEKHGAKR